MTEPREPLSPRRLPPRERKAHQLSSRWSLLLSLVFMTLVEVMLAVTLRRWEFAASAVAFAAAAGAGWLALPIAPDAPNGGREAPGRTDLRWGIAVVALVVAGFVLGALGTR